MILTRKSAFMRKRVYGESYYISVTDDCFISLSLACLGKKIVVHCMCIHFRLIEYNLVSYNVTPFTPLCLTEGGGGGVETTRYSQELAIFRMFKISFGFSMQKAAEMEKSAEINSLYINTKGI